MLKNVKRGGKTGFIYYKSITKKNKIINFAVQNHTTYYMKLFKLIYI